MKENTLTEKGERESERDASEKKGTRKKEQDGVKKWRATAV